MNWSLPGTEGVLWFPVGENRDCPYFRDPGVQVSPRANSHVHRELGLTEVYREIQQGPWVLVCVCVGVVRRMPRWADPGNLGSKEKVGREFGSGVFGSWGLWVSLKSCPGRNWM